MTEKLFETALGIGAPWFVAGVDFNAHVRTLTIGVDFAVGSRFATPGVAGEHPVHDTVTKRYRRLNFFQHECFLEVRVPRVRLPDGAVRQIEPPWAGKRSDFTLLFEALALVLCQQMTFAAAARLVGESRHRGNVVCEHYLDLVLAQADYSAVRELAIDEASRARGHDYITLAADAVERSVLAVAGITARTLQRWQVDDGLIAGDRRAAAPRPVPAHAMSAEERSAVLQVANAPHFADLPPARIVPMLTNEGAYLASESTFARILREQGQVQHPGRAKAPRKTRPPTTHVATTPRQVWCWDKTFLPTTIAGRWLYLYLILDLYSRKIVSWEVRDDDSDHAAHLVRGTALAEGIAGPTAKPVLHGDNGATPNATTVLEMLYWLGVKPSYSRPRVSDDNAYAEALIRTAKYRPEFPAKGFTDLAQASRWAMALVQWYNVDHRHSGIRYVSPAQRHVDADHAILVPRHASYLQVRERNPARWLRPTRSWTPIATVTLNPEKDVVAGIMPKSPTYSAMAA